MIGVVDLGGTTSRVGISDSGNAVLSMTTFATLPRVEDEARQLRVAFRSLTSEPCREIVAGVAGQLNAEHTQLLRSPNLEQWVGSPIVALFQDALGAKVALHNDAALAGLGEAVTGAGKAFTNVAYLTISTGVGGCCIRKKRIVESADTFEPGMIIVRDGLSLEECIGGNALLKRTGVPAEKIEDARLWETIHEDLCNGLLQLQRRWQPDIFILGGGLTRSDRFSFPKLRDYLQASDKQRATPNIIPAELGDMGGLVGALCVYRSSPQ